VANQRFKDFLIMFSKVLVATDFSRHANRMLECIGSVPGIQEIVLVHVIQLSPVEQSSPAFLRNSLSPREVGQRALEEKRIVLEQMAGVPVRTLLVEGTGGDIAGAVIGAAKKENIPLIVMGGRGQSSFRNRILGSISDAVIRRTRTDVLIMHFRGMDGDEKAPLEKFCQHIFSHVLCPVDFSKPSDNTIGYLKLLGSARKVTLLYVLDPAVFPDAISSREQDAELRLGELVSDLVSHGIRATSLVRSGIPAQEISRVAEEQDVSLIMIARYGQSDYAKNIPLGRVVDGVMAQAKRPLFVLNPHVSLNVRVAELSPGVFYLAEQVWKGYHQQKGDPRTDRIFGVYVEETLAAVARCRRHPDGLEVDGVFVPEDYRGRGYARSAMHALIDACGHEPLFMHATLELVTFYATFGFVPIDESELPATIRERFNFAEGELKGSDVQPMKRSAAGT
jgi:nucleotide-binding universal stress UspA family protein/GNAT superfamily N-acetyltransferase